jgi:hypothetical protein
MHTLPQMPPSNPSGPVTPAHPPAHYLPPRFPPHQQLPLTASTRHFTAPTQAHIRSAAVPTSQACTRLAGHRVASAVAWAIMPAQVSPSTAQAMAQ